MKIESVTQQITRISPEEGFRWLVYAMVSYPKLPAMPQSFSFYTKRDAVAFCKAHAPTVGITSGVTT